MGTEPDTGALAGSKRGRLPWAAREQQLLDIAEDLFTAHGYEGTSIEDIARAAGVTRPIVYDHHGSKERIFLACVRRARGELEESLIQMASDSDDSTGIAELVERGGEIFFAILERNPRRWALLFSSSCALSGELSEQLTEMRFRTVDRIIAIGRQLVPGADEERLAAFAHALSGVGEQLGRWWLHNPHVPRDRIVGYFRDFADSGLASLRDTEAAADDTLAR